MNILVTGAAGFIGSHLLDKLSEKHIVYGLTHDMPAISEFWPSLRGDITDYPRMLEIIVDREIDQIYHCAAKSVVRNCRIDPLGCFHANVMGTATILEAARQSERVKGVMCMESDKAYGNGPTPYSEGQALVPAGIYEASKACVSHLVRTYQANYGLPVFGIRSANVYGPGDPNQSRLIPNTIRRLKAGQKPEIIDGAARFEREYLYINDFVHFATGLMTAGPWGESVNVGSGDVASVEAVVAMLCTALSKPDEWTAGDRPGTFTEIPCQSLDLTRMKELLVVATACTPLVAGLLETVNQCEFS